MINRNDLVNRCLGDELPVRDMYISAKLAAYTEKSLRNNGTSILTVGQ